MPHWIWFKKISLFPYLLVAQRIARSVNSIPMRKTHYIVTLICCVSFSALAQELVELNVFESGNFKTFVYKDSSEQLRGEWYIYNTPVDSFLFAFGPIAISGEDENYVQNGTWSYSNLGQKAKKVSYILGDEHSSDLRSNYHMGQSYFPIPLYHITNIVSKSNSFRPEWAINTVSADSNALSKVSLDISDLNGSLVIELPDLILNPDTKKINPETFRFQFQFQPKYNSSKELFNVKLASTIDGGYYLSCTGNGDIELSYQSKTSQLTLLKEKASLNVNALNTLDLQLNATGDFVLVLNDFVQSSRNLASPSNIASMGGTFKGINNVLEIKESMQIALLDLSMLQFVEETVNNIPGLLFRDISEIGLAIINGVINLSDAEVYMRELDITDLYFSPDKEPSTLKVSMVFPAKLDYAIRPQSLELYIYFDSDNKIERIEKSLNRVDLEDIDLKLLSQYLKDKFRTNTYALSGMAMNHNNIHRIEDKLVELVVDVKTTGLLFDLTAATSLRTGPSSSERVMLRFTEGDKVDLISKENVFWWMVKFKGKVGYVKAALLEPQLK